MPRTIAQCLGISRRAVEHSLRSQIRRTRPDLVGEVRKDRQP
ncbi:hypothetical protein [Streptomyces sp. NPDC014623]